MLCYLLEIRKYAIVTKTQTSGTNFATYRFIQKVEFVIKVIEPGLENWFEKVVF